MKSDGSLMEDPFLLSGILAELDFSGIQCSECHIDGAEVSMPDEETKKRKEIDMNNKKVIIGPLIAATVLLAAMGCWFCWHCPSRFNESHELFWRQLAWNGVGLAAFAGAWAVGWKRLLKVAPWLMSAWIAAFVMAQFCRPINGAHKWISAGPVSINVVTCFMPVFALFVAWFYEKKWIRPWMEWTAVALTAIWIVWMMSRSVRWQARRCLLLRARQTARSPHGIWRGCDGASDCAGIFCLG